MNTIPGNTQPPVAPCQDALSKQQPKQKYKPNPQQTGLPPHSALPVRGKTKNKQKLSTNLTLYKNDTNHWTNLRRAETKRKKEFNLLQGKNSTFLDAWEKETSNTISLKKKIMKRQRNTTQMKKQIRNTDVQINEEEIGKLPEKKFRIVIVKVIRNLENRVEKMQESIDNDLEELKNKHTETTKLLKLKIL